MKVPSDIDSRRKRDLTICRIKSDISGLETALDRYPEYIEHNVLDLKAHVDELIDLLGIIIGDDIIVTD